MHIHGERFSELCRTAHRRAQDVTDLLDLRLYRLKHKFIMHLQEDAAFDMCGTQRRIGADHCNLDEVGSRALNRRIHRHALGKGALHKVAAAERRKIAPSTVERRHIAACVRVCNRFIQKFTYAVIACKVALDVARRLLARNAEVAREPEVAQTVDDTEVDRLCTPPLLARHGIDRYAEHLRCRTRMNVLPAAERVDERRIPRHMREDAQLDLRVIC